MIWIILTLIALAAVCNAVMDTVETDIAFNSSVFKSRDPKFWSKPVSAQNVDFLPLTRYRLDAWHAAKSLMVILLIGSIASARSASITGDAGIDSALIFIGGGLVWIGVFNFAYKLLKTK